MTRGHRHSLLCLSPDLAVTLIPSPLPRPPTDHERAGSGPQGQGHRRPAPGEQGDTPAPGVTSPSPGAPWSPCCPSLSPSQCFRKEAALHTRPAFHPTVASACQEQRTGTVGSVRGGLGSPLLGWGGGDEGPAVPPATGGGPRRGRRVAAGAARCRALRHGTGMRRGGDTGRSGGGHGGPG